MIYRYTWRVIYYNGYIIDQFDGDTEIMWKDVDTESVSDIYLIDSSGEEAGYVHVGTGKVEMCRRNHITLGAEVKHVEYMIGRDGEYTVVLE